MKFTTYLPAIAWACTVPASAEVIYSDLQDLAIPKNEVGVYLNVLTGSTSNTDWHINPTFGGIYTYNNSTFQPVREGSTGTDTLSNIPTGDLISSSSTNFATGMGVSFDHLGTGSTPFTAATEGYIGFSVDNSSTNYGWMRVVFTGDGTPVIKDWAYDTSGGSIAAGNVIQSGSTYTVDSSTRSFTLGSAITGSNAVIKAGANTATLSTTNTYSGTTTVSAGTLALSSSGSIANSATIAVASGASLNVSAVTGGWTLGATQTLTGSGGVTGNTTIAGTHNAGDSGVGSQAFTGNLSYADSSIFEWDLGTSSTASGFDAVTAGGAISVGTNTVFKVVFGSTVLDELTTPGNSFWSTTQTWALADIFVGGVDTGTFQSVQTSNDVSSYGSFSITSSSLTWASSVPEPTTALAGILLAAGLLRRRR